MSFPTGGCHRLRHKWPRSGGLACVLALAAAASLAAQGGPYERQKIDPAASTRGRAVYTQHCINCHGSSAKGGERGPDLIRSAVVLRDRYGKGIGPAVRAHTELPPRLSDAEVVDLSHFLHDLIERTATNRNPRGPIDVLTGDPEAGRAFFNGAGGCSGCHSATGDLAGLATRIPNPVNLQQRWLFPSLRRDGPNQMEVTVTTGSRTVRGRLVRIDDFSVALRDEAGEYHGFSLGSGVAVVVAVTVHNPLAAHHELLDRYTDTNMHDMTTYLATLK
jgi:mono/diheme cytochrome c family protein